MTNDMPSAKDDKTILRGVAFWSYAFFAILRRRKVDYLPYYAEAVVVINENMKSTDVFTLKELFPTFR